MIYDLKVGKDFQPTKTQIWQGNINSFCALNYMSKRLRGTLRERHGAEEGWWHSRKKNATIDEWEKNSSVH